MKIINDHSTILLLVMLSFYSSLYAADLKVKVLQKGSGDVIANATVVLEKSGEYGETDAFGEIKFDGIVLPDNLKVLSEGHESLLEKVAEEKTEITVYLEPLISEGELIEVLEDRVEEKTSKYVLSREVVRKAPGTQGDPLKAIQSLPGVVTGTEGTGIMYIRGSEPNQSITWVNRARIGYLYHFGGLHSTISPQLISDFNMFLGGFPVEYGDALGGALDVKLRTPKKDRWHQYYSFGTYESSAVLEGPVGKKNGNDSVYISARRSYIDLFLDPNAFSKLLGDEEEDEDAKDSVTEVPVFYDLQAVWQHDLPNGRLLLQHFSAADSIKLILNSPKSTDPSARGELSTRVSYHSSSLVWEQKWNPQLYSTSSLYFIHQDQSLKIGTDDNGKPFFLDIVEDDFIWQPEIRWLYNDSTTYTAGVEAIYAHTPVDAHISRPPGFDDIDFNLTTGEKFTVDTTYKSALLSPYIKMRKLWLNRFATQIGLRHTELRSNGRNDASATSPRFSAEYELTKQTTLTGVWGKYFQLPEGTQWVRDAGNPNLPFLESEHRIIGVRHEFDKVWNMQIEAYHKPMKNLVVTYDGPAPDNYRADGTGEAFGFDILMKREYSGRKMGWLSYSYLESSRSEPDGTFPFAGDQRHTFTLVWSQPFTGSWKRWNWGVRARINSGKPYTPLDGRTGLCKSAVGFYECSDQVNAEQAPNFSHWQANWAEKNSSRLPSFYQLDLRIDREILHNTWKMNVYLDILNVFNIKNISGYDYGKSLENIDDPKKQFSLPIFPSFGLEIEI